MRIQNATVKLSPPSKASFSDPLRHTPPTPFVSEATRRQPPMNCPFAWIAVFVQSATGCGPPATAFAGAAPSNGR